VGQFSRPILDCHPVRFHASKENQGSLLTNRMSYMFLHIFPLNSTYLVYSISRYMSGSSSMAQYMAHILKQIMIDTKTVIMQNSNNLIFTVILSYLYRIE